MSKNLHDFDKEIQNYLIENQDEDLLNNAQSSNRFPNNKDLSNSNYQSANPSAIKKPNQSNRVDNHSPNLNPNMSDSKLKFMEYMDHVKDNTDSYQKKLLELAQLRVDIDNKNKKLGDLENIKHILMEENK